MWANQVLMNLTNANVALMGCCKPWKESHQIARRDESTSSRQTSFTRNCQIKLNTTILHIDQTKNNVFNGRSLI